MDKSNIEDIREELLDDMRVELEGIEMSGTDLVELVEKESEFKKLQEKVRILESRPVIGMVNGDYVIINCKKEIVGTLKVSKGDTNG